MRDLIFYGVGFAGIATTLWLIVWLIADWIKSERILRSFDDLGRDRL